MPDRCLLALDCGTHAMRAICLDLRGRVLGEARRPLVLNRPAPGYAEQDAVAMRLAARSVLDEILRGVAAEPTCLGIATQRSSIVCWDRQTGEPLSAVLSWQDTRAADRLEPLADREAEIIARTGLRLSPHYGASKLSWALAELPAVAKARDSGRLCMGPLAAWLLRSLRGEGEPEVDEVNASRTLLWNMERRDWDPWLLELFSLPATTLPRCRPVRGDYGRLQGHGVPITAMSGDQNAALFADGPLASGRVLVNLGTGAFVLQSSGSALRPIEGLLCGLADSEERGATYLTEGTVNGAGAALSWAEERWGLQDLASRLDEYCASGVQPAIFLNAVGGLGSPWWRHDQESRLLDAPRYLDGDRPRNAEAVAAIVQGIAESVLFLIRCNLDLMKIGAPELIALRVSGGLAQSDRLCERLAALCGLPVERSAEPEATARGIAWLAAGRPEDWHQFPLAIFAPRENAALRDRYGTWLAAMRLCT